MRSNVVRSMVLMLVTLFMNCAGPSSSHLFQRTFFKFDTVVTIKITDRSVDEKSFHALMKEVKKILDHYDEIFNMYNKKSSLFRITKFKAGQQYPLNSDIYQLLKEVKRFYKLTEGYFDPTIGSVTQLYDFTGERKMPSGEDLKKALEKVGMEHVVLIEPHYVILNRAPVRFDLGGAAKGYIIDKIARFLKNTEINDFLINIGGDIFVSGDNPYGKKWKIGLQDPRNKSQIITQFDLTDSSVVSSGDYERFFIYKGKRYHHIIDPFTGYPIDNNIISVTVVAGNALLADILSTSVFLLGREKGIALLKKFKTKYVLIEETADKGMEFYSNFLKIKKDKGFY
ncbi:MAG: FAD:protein FMN transferase [Spirochaetes bacterium]|nr:FAD:protein FMN transferase [Spirochaetota bacterium]